MRIKPYIVSFSLSAIVGLLFVSSVLFAGDGPTTGSPTSNVFLETVTPSTSNLTTSVVVAPSLVTDTSTLTIYISENQSNNPITAEYSFPLTPAQNLPADAAGSLVYENISLPADYLFSGTNYFSQARVSVGTQYFFSNMQSFTPTSIAYGDNQIEPSGFTVSCGGDAGDTIVSELSAVVPCVLNATTGGISPTLSAVYGPTGSALNNLISTSASNVLLDAGDYFTFSVSFSGLDPNTGYSFKIVDGVNPSVSYAGSFTFQTLAVGSGGPLSTDIGVDCTGVDCGNTQGSEPFQFPEDSIVKCDGTPENPCRFQDAIDLADRAIDFIILLILPLAAILSAYAGFRYLTSGGNTNVNEKMKSMLFKVFLGLVFVLAAWLIVNILLSTLLSGSDYNLLNQ